MPRLKVTTFTVRASQDQARRWAQVARWLKYRSVAAWLEEMAEGAEQPARRNPIGGYPELGSILVWDILGWDSV